MLAELQEAMAKANAEVCHLYKLDLPNGKSLYVPGSSFEDAENSLLLAVDLILDKAPIFRLESVLPVREG